MGVDSSWLHAEDRIVAAVAVVFLSVNTAAGQLQQIAAV